uniref:Immunoglobulin domain-containing protein n=1 Tax=Esox lucius TaxID=8010 RepID=A0AAY5KXE4_ESOLU
MKLLLEMSTGPFSCFSKQGVLLLFILHHSVGESLLIHKTVGDSVELPCPSHLEEPGVTSVVWKYGKRYVAEYYSDVKYLPGSPLEGRLEMNSKNVSLTVKDLKLQDSGTFSVTGEWAKGQIPTKTITLKVHEPVSNIVIFNKVQLLANHSCSVQMMCIASGSSILNYTCNQQMQFHF